MKDIFPGSPHLAFYTLMPPKSCPQDWPVATTSVLAAYSNGCSGGTTHPEGKSGSLRGQGTFPSFRWHFSHPITITTLKMAT